MVEKIEYIHQAEIQKKFSKWKSIKYICKFVPFVTKTVRILKTMIIEIWRLFNN